jgi:flagellar basal body rod protein FlgG
MKINYAKEPNEAHKNNLKEEILQVINENFIEMILDMVKMYRRYSRNSKTTKIENLKKQKKK